MYLKSTRKRLKLYLEDLCKSNSISVKSLLQIIFNKMDSLREMFGQERVKGFLIIFKPDFKDFISEEDLKTLSRGPFKDMKPIITSKSILSKITDYEYNNAPILYIKPGDDIKNGEIVELGYNIYKTKGKFYMIKNNPRNTALYVGPNDTPIELLQKITGKQFFYYIGDTPETASVKPFQEDFDVIELKDPIQDPKYVYLSEPIKKVKRNWFYIIDSTHEVDIKGIQDIGQDSASILASFMDEKELSEIKNDELLSNVEAVKLDLTEKEVKLKKILETKDKDIAKILRDLYDKGYKDSEILKVAKRYTDEVTYFMLDELIHMINDIENMIQSPKEAQLIKNFLLNNRRDTALVFASEDGHLEVVRLLLENGANIHARDDDALRETSKNGHLEVVRLLLEKGANVHARDDEALRFASENGHLKVVRLLLENGANVHARDDEALRKASEHGHLEVVRLLIEKGADVYAEDGEALRSSSYYGHLDVVRLLLENGASIPVGDDRALLWALKKGHSEIFRLLIENIKEPKEGESLKQKIIRLQNYRRVLQDVYRMGSKYVDPEREERRKEQNSNSIIMEVVNSILKEFNYSGKYKYTNIKDIIEENKDLINIDDIIYIILDMWLRNEEDIISFLEEVELSQVESK